MSDLNMRLVPNRGDVVSKIIDGEAIVINLSNGIYYSMDGSAGLIWGLIAQGCTVDEILRAVTARYDVAHEQAESDVRALVAQLLEEKLIESSNSELTASGPPVEAEEDRLTYSAPVLGVYRDMGDLLALDPPQPGLENTPWRAADGHEEGK